MMGFIKKVNPLNFFKKAKEGTIKAKKTVTKKVTDAKESAKKKVENVTEKVTKTAVKETVAQATDKIKETVKSVNPAKYIIGAAALIFVAICSLRKPSVVNVVINN